MHILFRGLIKVGNIISMYKGARDSPVFFNCQSVKYLYLNVCNARQTLQIVCVERVYAFFTDLGLLVPAKS